MNTVLKVGIGALIAWLFLRRPAPASQKTQAGAGGAGSAGGAGGAGGIGIGGAGGAGGSISMAAPDYSSLAAAISALAAGVALPNIQSAVKVAAAGDTELVAATGGKRICVLAYTITGTGAFVATFQSAGSDLWKQEFDSPAGASGANLATAWPGFLFASGSGQNLSINLTGPATVSITYWQEAA